MDTAKSLHGTIDTITYDNFGTKVRLYLFDRPGGEN